MPSPGDAIRYANGPDVSLRKPHAIVAFGGWTDAGTGGTGAVRHLVTTLGASKLADLDPEEFYSFTDTRPLTSVVGPGERVVHWPRAEFFSAALPETESSDLLLFVSPEPNLRWRSFADAVLDVLERAGAQSLTCVGAIFGAIHHRADVPLTGWATHPRLREQLRRQNINFTSYEGPTGFVTVLLAEAQARGLPAAAIFGFASNYVQGVPNPRVSLAVLRAVSRAIGVNLPLAELERGARALTRQVDRLLSEQPELREQVERMLSLMNVTEPPSPAEAAEANTPGRPPAELPSPQAVVRELEEYLKQLREGNGGPAEPGSGT